MKLHIVLAASLLVSTAFAQGKQQVNGAGQPVERGVVVHPGDIYIQPDTAATRLDTIERGRELVVLEHGAGDWIHVLASVQESTQEHEGKDVTGWMRNRGVVFPNTPSGDRILFGEAADSEAQASRRGGRKGADRDAIRLYFRASEYFPDSPLAGQALYRAADDRWQIERLDVMSLPSARERDANMRQHMDEEWMRQVMRKFPKTRWADLAAFRLIENKLCGDWQGESKCPEKESGLYEDYVKDHPDSPAAAEALYEAAWRQAALIEIYKTENKSSKSPNALEKATALAQRVATGFPNSDYSSRAQALLYLLQQGIPVYGNGI